VENYSIGQNSESKDLDRHLETILIPRVYEYIRDDNYNKALESIDEFYQENLTQDGDEQIKNRCESWKAHIFEKQEKYYEALSIYRSSSELIDHSDQSFVYRKLDIARVLYRMGNLQEAASEAEEFFEAQAHSSDHGILSLLELYTDILEETSREFPTKYNSLVENLAGEIGIEISLNHTIEDSNNINLVVKEMAQKNRDANKRYSHLQVNLDKVETEQEAELLLRRYISEESVGFYRNSAIEELDQLSEQN
jgi:tetratricopeptide (TPR) repeat protein